MHIGEYQGLAQRTANESLDVRERLSIAGLGLCGEAGEVAEHIKKHIGHGHDLDRADVAAELGDVLWYVAEIAAALGLDLDVVAFANVEKLRRRYPDGFSEQASRERSTYGDDR